MQFLLEHVYTNPFCAMVHKMALDVKDTLCMQMRASFYKGYATRMASWGFAVLQYDVPVLTTLPDAPEVLEISVTDRILLILRHS